VIGCLFRTARTAIAIVLAITPARVAQQGDESPPVFKASVPLTPAVAKGALAALRKRIATCRLLDHVCL
jgi:hypothetical protein